MVTVRVAEAEEYRAGTQAAGGPGRCECRVFLAYRPTSAEFANTTMEVCNGVELLLVHVQLT